MELPLDFAAILDGIDRIGIYITDRDRQIVYWNRAATEITGYPGDEIRGRCCRDNLLCHADRHGRELCPTETCPLHRSIESGTALRVPVFVFARHRQGHRVPLQVTVSPVHDRSGAVIGALEVFREAVDEWRQVQLAQCIQRQMMPTNEQLARRWPLAFAWSPADVVGGDFVQVAENRAGELALLVADVAGHGLASAMVTPFLWKEFGLVARVADRPTEMLTRLATEYRALGIGSHHFSAICATADLRGGTLRLASAGHPPPLLVGADGAVATVDLSGDLIGLVDDPQFEERDLHLAGQRVVVITDGIPEARNPEGQELGESAVAERARDVRRLPPAAAAQSLIDLAITHAGRCDPDDDMTALVLDLPFDGTR